VVRSAALVTVITPAYNVAPWIGEAIDSVLAQTERRFDYVVVDDGSTDGTPDIVRERAARDSRIRLVVTENGGSAAARNVGIAQSGAPFIAFLDGDDRWNPRFLRTSLDALDAATPDVGATFVHTRVMLESGRPVGLRWQPAGPVDLDRMLIENCPPHNGSSLVLRRRCFEEVGGFDTTVSSATDFEMWLRIGARATTRTFLGLRRYLVDMRLMRRGSISSNRAARYDSLERIIGQYSQLMRRQHPGMAWIRPAVFAYRDGFDDIGDRWAERARSAGTGALARDVWGRSLLAWWMAGPNGRVQMRTVRDGARAGIYKGVATAMKAVNA
jgi:Glycosyl transferase family 2